jgi:hypothetical protein
LPRAAPFVRNTTMALQKIVITEFMDQTAVDALRTDYEVL